MGENGRLPESTRLGRVALRVNDLERMAGFYRDVVGLRTVDRSADRHVLGADEPLLVLIEDSEADERHPEETGLYHTAFLLPGRVALGAALERIRSNWRLDGASDHLVSEALYLTDPEDNGIEIYRDRPRDSWPRTADGRVRIDSKPLDLGAILRESDGETAAPPETTVGHVHLEVSSIEDSKTFYVDGLGMDVQLGLYSSAIFVSAGGYHHHIGLNTWHGRSEPATGRGLEWFEVLVPDSETLSSVAKRFDRLNWPMDEAGSGIDAHDPDRIALRLRVGVT